MGKNSVNASAQTLLLLSLWDLQGLKMAVAKGQVVDRVKKKSEKSADYADAIASLEQMGAIELSGKGNSVKMTLTQQGLTLLGKGLLDEGLVFPGAIVRAKTANALLKWVREMGNVAAASPASNGATTSNGKVTKIESYESFKTVALETFDKLNRDFNLDNLVPIYRIRRAIGEQVERSEFNDWLLEMQSNDILQLLEGSVEDSAPDKIEDSIMTKVSGLRCYAKLLEA